MGSSLPCMHFKILSLAIQHAILSYYSFFCISHILDDFIFMDPSSLRLCYLQLDIFLQAVEYTGISIEESKTILPSHIVHGFEVYTLFQAHLLLDMLTHFCEYLHSIVQRRSATLGEWQSPICILSFACKVI